MNHYKTELDRQQWVDENRKLHEVNDELVEVLTEMVEVLRREAPGTPLNNQRFDALGNKALRAIARAEAT